MDGMQEGAERREIKKEMRKGVGGGRGVVGRGVTSLPEPLHCVIHITGTPI